MKKIVALDLFGDLQYDLHSYDIIKKSTICDEKLLDVNYQEKYLFIKREYVNIGNKVDVAGYVIIFFVEGECTGSCFKNIRFILKEICISKANGNYKQIDPYIICEKIDPFVQIFINFYNELQNRKPFEVVLFEK